VEKAFKGIMVSQMILF